MHLVNTSVVPVLFGYSKGARKVSGKCIKGTPAVLRRCLQGTRLSITARDYFSWITSRRQAQFLVDLSWSTMPRFVLTTHMTERAVAQWLALCSIKPWNLVKAKLPWVQLLTETAWRTVFGVSEWTLVQTHKLPVSPYTQFALTPLRQLNIPCPPFKKRRPNDQWHA